MTDSGPIAADEMVNLFSKRLNECSIDKVKDDARAELNAWRDSCYKTIDEIYQCKLEELNSCFMEVKQDYDNKVDGIRTNMHKLSNQHTLNEENLNLIKELPDVIEADLKYIEDISTRYSIRYCCRPLNIDRTYVHILKDLTLNELSSPCAQFNYSSESSPALASNEEFLLIHQYPYLSLIDRDCRIVRQTRWSNDWIRDICWSTILKCFIIITTNNIYLVNDMLKYNLVENNLSGSNWFSCACSDNTLYLSTYEWGSSIVELDIRSNFACVNHWKTPATCEINDGINDIKYTNDTLALMINNFERHEKRMDLKSVKDFTTIWSLGLSAGTNFSLFTCCPINSSEWLIIDGTNSNIYHVSKDGKFQNNKRQNSIIYRANRFSSALVAIVTEHHLDLYRI